MIRALAVWRMASRKANGILRTWCQLAARVNTLLLYARSIIWTLSVKVTLHSATLHERIALQSRQTATRSSVLIAEAFRVQCTRILERARIQALSVIALLIVGTFAVRLASQLEASKLCISRVTRLAAAHRIVILHVAIGVLTTVTRVGANLVDAALAGSAVRVGATLGQIGNRWYAVVVGIFLVSSWAVTYGIVQLHMANGSTTADILRARVDTMLVKAGSIQRAVIVHGTFLRTRYTSFRYTLDVRISDVFRGTRTLGPMSAGYTLCIHSAWFSTANQHTLSSYAAIGVGTIVIRSTSFDHYRLTLTVCVYQHIGWTSTDHRSKRQCIDNGTRLLS